MKFFARVKPQSAIGRAWRDQQRVGAELCGVAFRRQRNQEYETGELLADQLTRLRDHPDVDIVAHGVVGMPSVVVTPPARPPAPAPVPDAPKGVPDAPKGIPDAPKGIPDAPKGIPDAPKGIPDAPRRENRGRWAGR